MDDVVRIGAHHSVFLLGILQLFKCFPEMAEGFKKINEEDDGRSSEIEMTHFNAGFYPLKYDIAHCILASLRLLLTINF
jgi:hypothetical protein